MKKEKIDLFYGALLHDIGKVIQRATGERKKHALVGADCFDELIIRSFPIKLDITWLTTRVINLEMTISLT